MDIMNSVLVYAGIIGVIVGIIVQVIKGAFPIPKNFVPILAIGIGVVIAILGYPFTDLDLTLRIWAGVFSGLASVGLYEVTTNRSGTTKEQSK